MIDAALGACAPRVYEWAERCRVSWFEFPRREASATVPPPDRRRTLALYKYDSCGYCQRVLRAAGRLGISLDLRDTRLDPQARSALIEATGGTQVPCLFVDGVPLLESADIIRWLEEYVENVPAPR